MYLYLEALNPIAAATLILSLLPTCHVLYMEKKTVNCCFWVSGGGRTAFTDVSPNNFPFYDEDEKYVPMLQSDGAQLSGKISTGHESLEMTNGSMAHPPPRCNAAID